MKKLLLALTILTSTSSLHSMEVPSSNIDYSKLPTITLPQIYHHLSEILLPDIAFYIFSLQPGTSEIDTKISLRRKRREGEMTSIVYRLKSHIHIMLHHGYGHCLTVEMLKRNLLRKNISICEITDDYTNETILHNVTKDGYTKDAKLFLMVAGHEVLTLLTHQLLRTKRTALHIAVEQGHVNIVKLFLDAAGDNAQILMNIQDNQGKTAFDIATPEAKEVMLTYIQNNQ